MRPFFHFQTWCVRREPRSPIPFGEVPLTPAARWVSSRLPRVGVALTFVPAWSLRSCGHSCFKGLSLTSKKSLPPALSSVALIDAPTCAAVGGMSVSWWHDEVREGRAPAPAVRQPRCTRWRMSDVVAFWQAFATNGAADTRAAELVTAKAKKASAAARVKRATAAQGAAA